MPGRVTADTINAPWPIGDHIRNEEIEVFRLSGFCDQAVVDPKFVEKPSSSMMQVIFKGGSLN
ncbi:MAG: hypothetical protein H6799_00615 [Candidatus Nomurabacteria bacterium]|nr:MAG: hypothetical protein H6799_00615 [Candidatus Nomurabacteria bacterium]HRV76261.1 hypothetical protein [Candidatus Saccharimonadales bacterium]